MKTPQEFNAEQDKKILEMGPIICNCGSYDDGECPRFEKVKDHIHSRQDALLDEVIAKLESGKVEVYEDGEEPEYESYDGEAEENLENRGQNEGIKMAVDLLRAYKTKKRE